MKIFSVMKLDEERERFLHSADQDTADYYERFLCNKVNRIALFFILSVKYSVSDRLKWKGTHLWLHTF